MKGNLVTRAELIECCCLMLKWTERDETVMRVMFKNCPMYIYIYKVSEAWIRAFGLKLHLQGSTGKDVPLILGTRESSTFMFSQSAQYNFFSH